MTISPAVGSASTQTLTFSASDSAGISSMHLLISSSTNTVNACWMYFDGSGLSLASDNTATWSTSYSWGTGSTLYNNQCNVTLVSNASAGGTLTFTLTITLTSSFPRPETVYMQASYPTSQDTGYQPEGTWSGSSSPLAVSPASGSGMTQTFTFTAADPQNVSNMNALFNTAVSGAGACWMYFDGSYLSLADDSASNWSSAGQGTALQNSQCTVTLGSHSSAGGSSMNFAVAIVFKSAFAGARTIYMRDTDGAQNDSGYQQTGTWTVQ